MNKKKKMFVRAVAIVLAAMIVLGVFTALLSSLWS